MNWSRPEKNCRQKSSLKMAKHFYLYRFCFERGRVTDRERAEGLRGAARVHAGKGNDASGFWKSGKLIKEKKFCGLEMIPFKFARVMHFTPWSLNRVNCGVPFSFHAGKGKCCNWLLKKRKFICGKYVLLTANGLIWTPQGHTYTPFGAICLWGIIESALSLHPEKRDTPQWNPKVDDNKGCTLGHSNWTTCTPHGCITFDTNRETPYSSKRTVSDPKDESTCMCYPPNVDMFIKVQGSSYLLDQKFCACFILKFALRGERGRTGRDCKFQHKYTQPLTQEIPWALYFK